MAEKILLTISILISNRPDTVRKCLDSVKPLLEAVPSELILTDTGCGEKVRTIIEEYTDHIIDFEWCKDFAKARNVGLRAARGEWFLFLDDDEWFDDVTEIVKFFTSGEHKKYGYGLYIQRNYMDKDAVYHSDLLVARMIRLGPKVAFMYPIHECFNCVPGKVKNFNVFVHHYGYAYDSLEEARAHAMRNVELLLVEHKKYPRNMKHTLQLAQEYNSIKEWEKSLEISLEGIRIAESGPVELEFCTPSNYANVVQNYMRLNRVEEGIEAGERFLQKRKLDPYAVAMIAGILGEHYLKKNELDKCMDRISLYEKVYKDYCRDPESFIPYETTITSNCFDMLQRSVTFGCGVRAALAAGKPAKALRWFHKIDMEGEKAFVSTEMISAILRHMAGKTTEAGDSAEAGSTPGAAGSAEAGSTPGAAGSAEAGSTPGAAGSAKAESALEAGNGEALGSRRKAKGQSEEEKAALKEMCNTILCRKDMEGVFVKEILETFLTGEELCAMAGLESEHWIFALANALSGEDREENARSVWRHMDESFSYIMRYRLMEVLESAGCDIGSVLGAAPFYMWNKVLTEYIETCSDMEMDWWHSWFMRLPDSEVLKKSAWERLMLYRMLAGASRFVENGGEAQGAQDLLWDYSSMTVSLCEKIYLPEMLQGDCEVLSARHRAAFYARDLRMAMEEGRYREAVELARQIRELIPELTGVVKAILLKIQEETQETPEQKEAANEMQILGVQIKLKIRQLRQAGRDAEALAVARQLAGLLPGDEDLKRTIRDLEGQV